MARTRGPRSLAAEYANWDLTKEAELLQFQILQGNASNFQITEKHIRRSFQTTYWMNVALFAVGVGAFVGAIVKGFTAHDASDVATSGVFAGLSVASFVSAFIFRPLESIEQDSIYITWLLSVFNTYLYRLVYFNNQETLDADLCRAEENLVAQLKDLAENHARNASKYGPVRRSVRRRARASQTVARGLAPMRRDGSGGPIPEEREPASVDGHE